MAFLSVFPCSQTFGFFRLLQFFWMLSQKWKVFVWVSFKFFFVFFCCVFSVLFHFHSFCRKNFNFEWRAGNEIFSRTWRDGGFWVKGRQGSFSSECVQGIGNISVQIIERKSLNFEVFCAYLRELRYWKLKFKLFCLFFQKTWAFLEL